MADLRGCCVADSDRLVLLTDLAHTGEREVIDDVDDVVARANDTVFGLAAGVFTQDLTRAHRVVKGFQAGTCYINHYNAAPVEMPFGGSKLSGVGRENSKAAIQHYSQSKTVYVGMGEVEAPF